MNNLNWDYLRYFLSVAEQGSLSAAARTMNQSQATVWRKIYALEQVLGTQLFDASRTGYGLTAAGLSLVPIAKRLASETDKLRDIAHTSQNLRGVVRIAAPDIFSEFLCQKLVMPFQQTQPGIVFDLFTSSPAISLAERDSDIALLVSKSLHQNLSSVCKVKVAFDLYATEKYLQSLAFPLEMEHLARFSLIDFDQQGTHLVPTGWPKASAKMARVMCSNSPALRIAAVQQNLGVALLPKFIAQQHPAMVSVFPQYDFGFLKLELCVNKSREKVPTVATSAQFLAKKLRRFSDEQF